MSFDLPLASLHAGTRTPTPCTSRTPVPRPGSLRGFWRRLAGTAALLALAAALPVHAQAPSEDARRAELEAASQAAQAAQVAGPADVKLREQGVLKLPEGYVWIPDQAAAGLMRAMGNSVDARLLGLVFPAGDGDWMMVAEYEPSGYVKDDDARDWNVDDLFQSLKDGTDEANKERRERGFPELEIIGWAERPNYDAATHRLIWSLSAKHKGASDEGPQTINYNTYALGREGYVSLNLITDSQAVAQDKQHAQALLAALNFNDGKRYADFDASTDRVAEYGLAALVGGMAAKKLGFFAVLVAFFAKFAKVILLGGAAVVGLAVKLFKRNPSA